MIRGFALIGIALMNIEFFNRYTGDAGMGIAPGLSGPDLWFGYVIQYFVAGKFWTIFSLLFGMGFAVMLMRAESAGRSFFIPYLRRIAALALFGAAHYILLWSGDILFSYAVGALALLIVLYGRGKSILLGVVGFAALAAVPGMGWSGGIAGGIAFFGLCAWYLRCPDRITVFKRGFPVFKVVVGFLAFAAAVATLVGLFAPGLPRAARIVTPVIGALALALSYLMARYHNPVQSRPWRIGVGMYTVAMLMVTVLGAVEYFVPDPQTALKEKTSASAPAEAERIAAQRKEIDKMLAERNTEKALELRVARTGNYAELVAMRAGKFTRHAPDQVGFAALLITMFLIGLWFIRSGVMVNTGAHLPLFRKLAIFGLPIGAGLGLIGSLIASHAVPGVPNGYTLASGLLMLGNLPACLGYIGLVVMMLHSRKFSGIKALAPYGRMALTNYLTHSLVFSTIFYGYGFGYFGTERIWQLACVCAMVLLQVPLSRLWLSHFRYGPMEWLWRAITYWHLPAMRITPADKRGALQAA